LVGDHDQVYFKDGFKLTVQDKVSAHLYGLKRCISFVKNVKPLHCNDMIHFLHDNVRVDIDRELNDRIASDEYVQRFIEERGIKIGNISQLLEISRGTHNDLSTAIAKLYLTATKALN
jgi:hypothetical protein